MKNQKPTTEKPASKAKTKHSVAEVTTAEKPKKPNPAPKSAKKSQDTVSKPSTLKPEILQTERVGLTAGSIWQYLNKNGATSIAKLIREIPEEEKITQRSIGWLAQEDKITLDIINRVEIVSLK